MKARNRKLVALLAILELGGAAFSTDHGEVSAGAANSEPSQLAAMQSSIITADDQVPALSTPLVAVHSATGEQIKWQVISSGGGASSSANFNVSSTVGQSAIGQIASANYRLNQGYWQNFTSAHGCCLAEVGNVDCSPGDGVDVADLTTLIDNLFINFTPLCCDAEANCDGTGGIDVADLTALIDNLFINFTPLPSCP